MSGLNRQQESTFDLASLHQQIPPSPPAAVLDWSSMDTLEAVQQESSGLKSHQLLEGDTEKYQEAFREALADIPREEKEVVVLVLGCGRGRLVFDAVAEGERSQRSVRVIALEEDDQVVNSLQILSGQSDGRDQVQFISSLSALTTLQVQKVHIILSQISDSQLTPTRLGEALKYLKSGGVCIPSSVTSYLCPLQSSKLYHQLKTIQSNHEKLPPAANESLYNVKLMVGCSLTWLLSH